MATPIAANKSNQGLFARLEANWHYKVCVLHLLKEEDYLLEMLPFRGTP